MSVKSSSKRLAMQTREMLAQRIREEIRRYLAVEARGQPKRDEVIDWDMEALEGQVRALILTKLGRAKPRSAGPKRGSREPVLNQAMLEAAVREVVGRKLGLSGVSRGGSVADRPPKVDKETLERRVRQVLAEKLGRERGMRGPKPAQTADPLADPVAVKARMRETVIKLLSEMPAEGQTALTDEDIDRLIERALGQERSQRNPEVPPNS